MLNFTTLLAAVGVLFIGFSKAGFGGGLGMLTTPIACSPSAPAQAARFCGRRSASAALRRRRFFDLLLLGKVGAQEPEIPPGSRAGVIAGVHFLSENFSNRD